MLLSSLAAASFFVWLDRIDYWVIRLNTVKCRSNYRIPHLFVGAGVMLLIGSIQLLIKITKVGEVAAKESVRGSLRGDEVQHHLRPELRRRCFWWECNLESPVDVSELVFFRWLERNMELVSHFVQVQEQFLYRLIHTSLNILAFDSESGVDSNHISISPWLLLNLLE